MNMSKKKPKSASPKPCRVCCEPIVHDALDGLCDNCEKYREAIAAQRIAVEKAVCEEKLRKLREKAFGVLKSGPTVVAWNIEVIPEIHQMKPTKGGGKCE